MGQDEGEFVDIDLNSKNLDGHALRRQNERPADAQAGLRAKSQLFSEKEAGKTRPMPQPLGRQVSPDGGQFRDLPVLSFSAGALPACAGVRSDGALESRNIGLARRVSLLSLGASLAVAFLAVGIGVAEETLSLVGFGGEALLDGISSVLVLWRFKIPKTRQDLDDASAIAQKQLRDVRRERNSSIGIGVIFVLYAVMLLVSAVIKLVSWDPDSPEHLAEEQKAELWGSALAWPSVFIFGGLAVAKLRLARALNSQVLQKDALCSGLGAMLALICGVAALIEQAASDSPKGVVVVDVGAGAIIALILWAEGVRTLYHNMDGGAWASEHQPMS